MTNYFLVLYSVGEHLPKREAPLACAPIEAIFPVNIPNTIIVTIHFRISSTNQVCVNVSAFFAGKESDSAYVLLAASSNAKLTIRNQNSFKDALVHGPSLRKMPIIKHLSLSLVVT